MIRYEESDGRIKFIDNLEYICRKAGQGIQETVKYQLDPGEKLEKIEVSVHRPQGDGFGSKEVLLSANPIDAETVDRLSKGISLSSFKEIDGLKVVIEAAAFQDPKSFSFWKIAHPGRNIDISIIFPNRYSISCNLFVPNPDSVSKKDEPGYHRIVYRGWLLPENGLAWQLIPPDKVETMTSTGGVEEVGVEGNPA